VDTGSHAESAKKITDMSFGADVIRAEAALAGDTAIV
jgi:hypothetical protein